MQIIVLGMHRSGTSSVTRVINLMGANVGPEHVMLQPCDDNPKGYWERGDVMALNDAILLMRGCTWNRLANWSIAPTMPPPVKQIMGRIVLGMDAFRPWVMKDPRMCLTLPWWQSMLEVPIAVLVYRDPLKIVRSLEKRRISMSHTHSLALWEYHAVEALNATQNMERVFVRYEKMIVEPVQTVAQLFADLKPLVPNGLHLPSEREITAFITPGLDRAKVECGEPLPMLTPAQEAVAAMLRGEEMQNATLEVSAPSVNAMAQQQLAQGMETQALLVKAILSQH
jgi:hypothetical protein